MKRLLVRLTKPLGTVALLAGLAIVAGCDEQGGTTAAEHLQMARDHLVAGKPRASVIEIKNALQVDPENADARLMLGEVYLDLNDPLSAEKELLRAQDFGIAQERVKVPLGQAWLMQGEFQKVLDEVGIDSETAPADRADILVLRGNASQGLGELADASENYENALREQPGKSDAILGLGMLALSKEDLEAARGHLERLQETAPDDYRTTLLIGDIATSEGDYVASEAAYQKVLDARPHDLRAEMAVTWAKIQNGKVEEANEHLSKLLKAMRGSPQILFMRAITATMAADHQAAKDYAERTLEIEPKHLQSLFIAGVSSYSLNQLQSANKHLGKLVYHLPDHELARKVLAATQLQLGMVDRSAETLGGIEPLSASDSALFSAVASAAMSSGDFETGSEIYESLAAIDEGRAEARAQLGLSRLAVGEIEEGIEELEQALALDPELEEAGLVLVMSHLRREEFNKALDRAREIQAQLPDSPHAYTLEGLALAGKGDLAAAQEAFTKAWTISPGDLNAGRNLAAYALLQGEVGEARAIYKTVLESNPLDLNTLMAVARFEVQQRELESARRHLELAVEQSPQSLDPRILLSAVYLDQGEAEKVIQTTEGLVDIYPGNAALLEVVGLANFDRGDLVEALNAFKALVEAEPDLPAARYYLAHTYERLGRDFQARRQAKRLMELAPQHVEGRFLQARLLAAAGDLEAAQAWLEELKGDYPDNPNLLELEGQIALARNQPEVAASFFERAREGKRTAFLTFQLARAYGAAGDREKALSTLENWIAEVPDDLLMRMTLGTSYLELGRLSEAQTQFQAVVERRPESAWALNNLAWILSQQGDLDGALQHGERARNLLPDDPDILDTVGVIYLKKGNAEEAVSLLREAADKADGNPSTEFHLAQALASSGQISDATDLLRTLLARNPSFSERGEAQALLSELES